MNEASNERAIKSCLQTSRETYERTEEKKKRRASGELERERAYTHEGLKVERSV